ncbi:MAG: 30S ribosomal protein S6 [Desulfobacterales bacterium CG2_30_60_27]|nr:MAG: 30S ribosomal protein S6 [Desulfobacterales bacterium CG2_30_60_27]
MRRYETICIIRPGAGEEKISAIAEKTTGIIQQFGGTPLRVDHWGVKKLAYLIQKEGQGYYLYIEYAGRPEAVQEIERVFRIDDQVLKYMTVKTQAAYIPDPEVDKDEESVTAAAGTVDEAGAEQPGNDVEADA